MNNSNGIRKPVRGPKTKKLAQLNRRISRLSSELETLHYMQDRLERELETARQPATNLQKRPAWNWLQRRKSQP